MFAVDDDASRLNASHHRRGFPVTIVCEQGRTAFPARRNRRRAICDRKQQIFVETDRASLKQWNAVSRTMGLERQCPFHSESSGSLTPVRSRSSKNRRILNIEATRIWLWPSSHLSTDVMDTPSSREGVFCPKLIARRNSASEPKVRPFRARGGFLCVCKSSPKRNSRCGPRSIERMNVSTQREHRSENR